MEERQEEQEREVVAALRSEVATLSVALRERSALVDDLTLHRAELEERMQNLEQRLSSAEVSLSLYLSLSLSLSHTLCRSLSLSLSSLPLSLVFLALSLLHSLSLFLFLF